MKAVGAAISVFELIIFVVGPEDISWGKKNKENVKNQNEVFKKCTL